MKTKLFLFSILYVLLQNLSVYAGQSGQFSVKGVVVDGERVPMPGVTVQIKGTTQGTTTDEDGQYTIQVPDTKAILIFSFVGFQTQEVAIGGQRTVNVTLREVVTELNEMVVVGYGAQKKESVVASISSIKATGLMQTPASNIGIALAGRLPGLTVLQRSGAPGAEQMEFYIRGRSTTNEQRPLLMVDGVEREFSALDPHEIETISILKDASATAVYGVRGANGVIMVTTRRGAAGKPVIDVTMEQSWQSPTRLP
ncbi:MAG: carboxypeptidase-like regulatory domain-containing protein, partial [Anaerohalosphaeraceae bacterium]